MSEYKLVVVGSGGVGKSALTVQFVQNIFVERYDPTIEDSYRKELFLDGKHYTLEILDTAGQQEYTSVQDLLIKSGRGFLLCYSITDQESFFYLDALYNNIVNIKGTSDVPMILVGNKCDLDADRKITKTQIETQAAKYNCGFMETSALNKINVEEVFSELVRRIDALEVRSSPKRKKKKSKCCLV